MLLQLPNEKRSKTQKLNLRQPKIKRNGNTFLWVNYSPLTLANALTKYKSHIHPFDFGIKYVFAQKSFSEDLNQHSVRDVLYEVHIYSREHLQQHFHSTFLMITRFYSL